MMNSHCILAQVVDVQNYKRSIYSCCPKCCGSICYSRERYEQLYIVAEFVLHNFSLLFCSSVVCEMFSCWRPTDSSKNWKYWVMMECINIYIITGCTIAPVPSWWQLLVSIGKLCILLWNQHPCVNFAIKLSQLIMSVS